MSDWESKPISPTCQVLLDLKTEKFCDKPTAAAYPAMGGGWMALCHVHAMKHPYAPRIDELIHKGEKFE